MKNENDKIEILKQGISTEFWKLINNSIKESIEYLQKEQDSDEMVDLPADEYKLRSELNKAKRKYLENLLNTPENLISWFGKADNSSREFDPYNID